MTAHLWPLMPERFLPGRGLLSSPHPGRAHSYLCSVGVGQGPGGGSEKVLCLGEAVGSVGICGGGGGVG